MWICEYRYGHLKVRPALRIANQYLRYLPAPFDANKRIIGNSLCRISCHPTSLLTVHHPGRNISGWKTAKTPRQCKFECFTYLKRGNLTSFRVTIVAISRERERKRNRTIRILNLFRSDFSVKPKQPECFLLLYVLLFIAWNLVRFVIHRETKNCSYNSF